MKVSETVQLEIDLTGEDAPSELLPMPIRPSLRSLTIPPASLPALSTVPQPGRASSSPCLNAPLHSLDSHLLDDSNLESPLITLRTPSPRPHVPQYTSSMLFAAVSPTEDISSTPSLHSLPASVLKETQAETFVDKLEISGNEILPHAGEALKPRIPHRPSSSKL
jgi:hypothetical protein